MLLPWGTDAPIYHWPAATVGLIVSNVAAYAASSTMLDEESRQALFMSLGDGIHPLQWLTSIFCHGNAEHLIGNMIFLWAFGIVVEGKLGWWRFLAVYLGIGVVASATIQVALLGLPEPMFGLGASAAIYGLLAICLVWAPKNDLHCLSFFRFVPVPWDIPIMFFAALYIGLEVLLAVGSAGTILSAAAHSSGAIIGFLLGTTMVKMDLVDCENWDLYTVLRGQHIRPASGKRSTAKFVPSQSERAGVLKKPKKKSSNTGRSKTESMEDPSFAALRRLRMNLESRDVDASLAVYDKGLKTIDGWRIPEHDYREFIKLLIANKQWRNGVRVMETYLKSVTDPHPSIRVTLAQVLAYEVERPTHALRVLDAIPEGSLPGSLEPQYRKVRRKAEAMREEGVLELEGDSW